MSSLVEFWNSQLVPVEFVEDLDVKTHDHNHMVLNLRDAHSYVLLATATLDCLNSISGGPPLAVL